MASFKKPSHRADFHIAIICALPLEYDAASLLFDEFWDEEGDQYGRLDGDTNTYITGRMGKHNVVMALLPGMGKTAAASASRSFHSTYRGLKIAFLVGVCGGIPSIDGDNVFLGDVIISNAVVQYDFGRQFPSKFVPKDASDGNLSRPNNDIRSLIASCETELGKERVQNRASKHLETIQTRAVRKRRRNRYRCPEPVSDRLFDAVYCHMHREPDICPYCINGSGTYCERAAKATCEELGCDEGQLVPRQRPGTANAVNAEQGPEIFIGRIASGDTVMKSGEHRDMVAAETNAIAFEMEGAGAWDEVPCLVVKGVCDYADSHKNKAWQPYAAATAAAVMRAVLESYHLTDKHTSDPQVAPPWGSTLPSGVDGGQPSGGRVIANNTFGTGTFINQGDLHGTSSIDWNGEN